MSRMGSDIDLVGLLNFSDSLWFIYPCQRLNKSSGMALIIMTHVHSNKSENLSEPISPLVI